MFRQVDVRIMSSVFPQFRQRVFRSFGMWLVRRRSPSPAWWPQASFHA